MDVRHPTSSDLDRLLAGPPQVADTAVGPVEYAEAGDGPVLLSVHGSGGGWRYALGQAAFLALNGFRVVAPSRPGYLGTPLGTGRSYEQQAEALVALLDALGVARAGVLAFSGGGPPTYLLAGRHPDRVACLVEVAALSTTLGSPGNPVLTRLLFSRPGMELFTGLLRALIALRPALGVQLAMADETSQDRHEVAELAQRVMTDPCRAAFVTRVWMCSTRDVGAWLGGQRNDNDLMTALEPLELSGIRCPTLIVQGSADEMAARHSAYAAGQVPGAEVRTIPGGGHRALWIADDAAAQQEHVLAWVRGHLAASDGHRVGVPGRRQP